MKKFICIDKSRTNELGKEYECEVNWNNNNEYLVKNDMDFSYSYPMKNFTNNREYRRLKLLELKKRSEL